MKKIKIFLYLVIFIILPIVIGTSIGYINNKVPNLEDDFYYAVNADLIRVYKRTSKYSYSGYNGEIQYNMDNKMNEIIDELLESKENININNLYDIIMKKGLAKEQMIEPLKDTLDTINNSTNINDLINNLTKIGKESHYIILLNYSLILDPYDNNQYAIILGQPSMCYDYVDLNSNLENSMINSYVSTLKKYYDSKYDITEIRKKSQELFKFNQNLCKDAELYLEHSKEGNISVSADELKDLYPSIDVLKYFKDVGFNLNNYKIISKKFAQNESKIFTEENLEILKFYYTHMLLESYEDYLISNNLSYDHDDKAIKEKTYEIIKDLYSDTLRKKYIEKYVDEEKTKQVLNMATDIKNYYKKSLTNNDWLSKETKEKAIVKLENMKINFGNPYEPNMKDDELIIDSTKPLLESIINFNNKSAPVYLDKINKNDINAHKANMYPNFYNFNACYLPNLNEVYIPESIFEAIDVNDSYYTILGKFGAILSHEISHAFDSVGANYDEFGNLYNWWTDEDYKKFKDKQQDFIIYYNNYKTKNGFKVNGERTLNENIADVTALNTVVNITIEKGASNEDLKQLYEAYANLYASYESKEEQVSIVQRETHSPRNVRVNATLSSNDKFYEVYNITSKNKMYVPKEKRLNMW